MSDMSDPGGRVLGTLRSEDGVGVVLIEDRYDATIEVLWEALTDPARLVRWYGVAKGDLRVGGQFHTYVEGDDVEATGRVETCEPPGRFLVTTRETDESFERGQGVPPFDTSIEAVLTPAGGRTDLSIEVRGMPLDVIAFFGAGWQIHAEHLADHLAERDQGDIEARWNELVPAYQGLAAALG